MEIDEFLTKAAAKKVTELDTFKAVTKNWASNALTTLDEIEKICHSCGEQNRIADRYQLLRHYLDHLVQFCEGKIGDFTEIEPENNF